MKIENFQDRISIEPNLGKPYLREHQIRVSLILEYLASGMTMEDILKKYSGMKKEDILLCIAYGAEAVDRPVESPQNEVVYADFSEMAIDTEYQKEALAICREFEKSDWEALQLG
ncbi:MAG: DUF433 domain-containing protein [Okeania sp. SIO2H7]|nr:DUF433 domain-containing protein [Okeania sp. SIO2H7]